MDLTTEDVAVLKSIAKEYTEDEVELLSLEKRLIEGFTKFGTDELVTELGSRENLFRKRTEWLLENWEFAGKSSVEAFSSVEGTRHLRAILKSFGIPERDLDDETQSAQIKFWKNQHAEKYNPLRSPWGHHVRGSLRTCYASYLGKRSRNPVALAFSYQQYEPPAGAKSEEGSLEPYEINQDLSPEEAMIVQEALLSFQNFLKEEKPFRTKLLRDYKLICTIMPPGGLKYNIQEPQEAFLVAKGQRNCRVQPILWEEGKTLMVGNENLKDFRTNPYSRGKDTLRLERHPYDVYSLLVKGMQVEEIAESLRVGGSTAHNWVRHLEELFQLWWVGSDLIPDHMKDLAYPSYQCPGCGHLHYELPPQTEKISLKRENWEKLWFYKEDMAGVPRKGFWCVKCGVWDLTGVPEKVKLPTYPWDPVRGNQDIQERAAKYVHGMTVPVCGL